MSHHDDHLHDAELGPVISRLLSERPTASALELDLIKQRVRERVTRNTRRSRRTEFMRSRLAILSTLVLGMVLSTGGAGLAVSGFTSGNEVASTAQYGVATPGGGEVLGEENNGGGAGPQENNGGGPTQPARQVESGAQASGQ